MMMRMEEIKGNSGDGVFSRQNQNQGKNPSLGFMGFIVGSLKESIVLW